MGNTASVRKINFEDTQKIVKDKKTILISTLPPDKQDCLIRGTVCVDKEVQIINSSISDGKRARIVVYGMNSSDGGVTDKCDQLLGLGFYNIYVYGGGLFEWLLLQDIYGTELFPTTARCMDHLQFKGSSIIDVLMIGNT
jgi:hypothetical protein